MGGSIIVLVLIVIAVVIIIYNGEGNRAEHLSEKEAQLKKWGTGKKVVRIFEEHNYHGEYIELPIRSFNINFIPSI